VLRGTLLFFHLVIEIDTNTPNADRIALIQMLSNMIQGLSEKEMTKEVMDGLKVGARFQKAVMFNEFEITT